MSNEIWNALIGVSGALGGVWFGAKLSRQATQDMLAQQAKAEFASTFTSTLIKLHSKITNPGENRALSILEEDFPIHFAAYLKLRAVVPKKQQTAIEEAWKHYAEKDNYELPEEGEFYRFVHVLESIKDEHQCLLAIKHINALLSSIAT